MNILQLQDPKNFRIYMDFRKLYYPVHQHTVTVCRDSTPQCFSKSSSVNATNLQTNDNINDDNNSDNNNNNINDTDNLYY